MKVLAWGAGNHGQLGLGRMEECVLTPEVVRLEFPGGSLSAGGAHSIAVVASQAFATGLNALGELGLDDSEHSHAGPGGDDPRDHAPRCLAFIPAPLPVPVRKVSAGWDFTVFIGETGDVFGMGSNRFGQLDPCGPDTFEKPMRLGSDSHFLGPISDISCGVRHTLLVTESRQGLICLGDNRHCQCGPGDRKPAGPLHLHELLPSDHPLSAAQLLSTGAKIAEIVAGNRHSMLLLTDGTVWTWGDNRYGQLGCGSLREKKRACPAKVVFPAASVPDSMVEQVFAGWNHCIAIRKPDVLAWGRGDFGQLGDGGRAQKVPTPTMAHMNGSTVVSFAVGSEHCLAVTADESGSRLLAWGWNDHGQLGVGDEANRYEPTIVSLPSDLKPTQVFAGNGGQSFAVCMDEVAAA